MSVQRVFNLQVVQPHSISTCLLEDRSYPPAVHTASKWARWPDVCNSHFPNQQQETQHTRQAVILIEISEAWRGGGFDFGSSLLMEVIRFL